MNPQEPDPQLAEIGARIDKLSEIAHELHKLVQPLFRPASIATLRLTQTLPKVVDDSPMATFSIGVLNPTAVDLFWGIGGAGAEPNREAISQSGKSLLVLPVGGNAIEIGADPADLAPGDAVVFLLRFRTVQPAFFGAV